MTIRYSPLVRDALDHGYPVLALETANVTHSMPRPLNLETAKAVQEQILAADVVPAAIAAIEEDGAEVIILGCSAAYWLQGPLQERLNAAGWEVKMWCMDCPSLIFGDMISSRYESSPLSMSAP